MKTIIVTGAGSGLGQELAIQFSRQGYHLLLIGRSSERLTSTKNKIKQLGGTADSVVLDIRNATEVFSKCEEFSKSYNIYGLVNNAGVGHFGPFANLSNEQISEMLDTNVLGTILMTQAVIPLLQKNGEGRIMNIISTAGLRGKVNESVYVASKFAIRGFSESLQKEFEGSQLKINAVYMGGMDTPFWERSSHVTDTSRFRAPKEVAEIIFEQMEQETIIIESKKS